MTYKNNKAKIKANIKPTKAETKEELTYKKELNKLEKLAGALIRTERKVKAGEIACKKEIRRAKYKYKSHLIIMRKLYGPNSYYRLLNELIMARDSVSFIRAAVNLKAKGNRNYDINQISTSLAA